MARPRTPQPPVHLRADRMLDVGAGELVGPADLLIQDDRIVEVGPTTIPPDAVVIDLGDVTLLPGLMDMEVNLFMGGPDHRSPLIPVQEDPAVPGRKAAWFADAAAWIGSHSAIRAVSYFDGISPKGYDFRVDTSSASFDAWRTMSIG